MAKKGDKSKKQNNKKPAKKQDEELTLEDLEHVAENMGELQVRRLPVVNRDKRLVGIVALDDVARHEDHHTTGEATAGVSKPGGKHRQK